ncbi:MAG: phosphoribosylanthranilate isomerase [Armatimonadetes bacterium]|nr:phosphoribosylanthranilate isomerase [Armatimonadota bacterium]
MTRVKICGLTNYKDAELAIEFGADAIGFVHEPSSPRCISEFDLEWLKVLPPVPIKVAVFGRVHKPAFAGIFDLVQGSEWEEYPEPSTKRIHVLRVRPGQKASDFAQLTVNSSALLLDAYKDGAYGGTGTMIDWDFASEFVQCAERPVILAGGLNPGNVADAVRRVRPFMVDVSSGIEEKPGLKDAAMLKDFIQNAKQA